MSENEKSCELCGEVNEQMFLAARCHPSAPLMAIKHESVLILKCYLPECGREVVRFNLAGTLAEGDVLRAENERLRAALNEIGRLIDSVDSGGLGFHDELKRIVVEFLTVKDIRSKALEGK